MVIRVKDSTGTLRTVTRVRVMEDGVLRTVARVKVKDSGGTERLVFVSLSVSTNVDSLIVSGGTPYFVSGTLEATVNGGVAPYTYSWSIVGLSGSGTATLTNPSGSSTQISVNGLINGGSLTGTARLVVSDSSPVSQTIDIPFRFTYIDRENPLP